jgi:hypothetical protein
MMFGVDRLNFTFTAKTQRAQRVFSYFFALKGRKEINLQPCGQILSKMKLTG